MPLVSVPLNALEDKLIGDLAKREGRSKRKQLKTSALAHARSVLAGEASKTKKVAQ